MERVRVAPEYSSKWLEVERPQPLCDNYLESLFSNVFKNPPADHSIAIHDRFKELATDWIFGSKLNNLQGFDAFEYVDVMSGCTQFIDNIYMQQSAQTLTGDYKYHERLSYGPRVTAGKLLPRIPLILALPFPSIGTVHPNIEEILDECVKKNIPVHIDGAWISCSRNVNFNFNHPAISSVGISLSKGLGLGWNRIGLRWSRLRVNDSISIMNDFHMQNRALSIVANYVLENVESDYLWTKYGDANLKICNDFGLTPSDAIHMAWSSNGQLVGLSPLIRHLNNE